MKQIYLKRIVTIWLLFVLGISQHNAFANYLTLTAAPGDYTVALSPTDETCAGNGKITVNITDAVIGATYSIELYETADMSSSIAVTSIVSTAEIFSYTFNGLEGAGYTVKVTESASGSVINKNQTVTLNSSLSTVSYNAYSYYDNCGYKLYVNVTSSASSVESYELRDLSGTVIKPAQTTNTFTDVTAGTYRIYVKDLCGQYYTLDHTVNTSTITRNIQNNYKATTSCTHYTANVKTYTLAGSAMTNSPFNYVITFSNGTPSISGTMTNMDAIIGKEHEIPVPAAGTSYVMTVTYTDLCGVTTSKDFTINRINKEIKYNKQSTLCGEYINFYSSNKGVVYPLQAQFLSYPSGFVPSAYNPYFSGTSLIGSLPSFDTTDSESFGSSTNLLPVGNYSLKFTDACGYDTTINFSIYSPTIAPLTSREYPGCELGKSQLVISHTSLGYIDSVKITGYPASYTGSLSTTKYYGGFYTESLPAGTYTATAYYSCNGVQDTLMITDIVKGMNAIADLEIIPQCGSYTISGEITSNVEFGFYTIKKNIDGTLTDVYTLMDFASSYDADDYTSFIYENSLTVEGDLTLYLDVFQLDGSICSYELFKYQIDIDGPIVEPYVFACGTDKVSIGLDVIGKAPFNHKIISKNGSTFVVDNGTNPVFNSLDLATYVIEVEDDCGNTKLVTVAANSVQVPSITANNLCEGEAGTLSLPNLSFMSATWTKDGAALPTGVTVSSDGYTLNFANYNKTTHTGTYQATLAFTGASSCPTTTVSYTLTSTNDLNPNAGVGDTVILAAGSLSSPVDLFDYITGTYDAHGKWRESSATPSGLLINNLWSGHTLTSGNYSFQYIVNGSCSGADTAFLNISIVNLIATNDIGSGQEGAPFIAVSNVLTNDNISGNTPVIGANAGQVNLSMDGTWPPGITLDVMTGEVLVNEYVATGTYDMDYIVCINGATPAICTTATVTVNVIASVIDPKDDMFIVDDGEVETLAGNILTNDSLNGNQATVSNVSISVITPAVEKAPGYNVPYIDIATGEIISPEGTAKGTYTITYEICMKPSGTICDTAVATVVVIENMPLQLLDFSAQAKADDVVLLWNMQSNHPVATFDVIRSTDGRTWETITTVAANDYNSSSQHIMTYYAVDTEPVIGMNMYRIKLNTQDAFEYSTVEQVVFDNDTKNIITAPNPIQDYVQVMGLTQGQKVQIIDISGRIVHASNVTGATTQISTKNLPAGIYHLQVIQNNQILSTHKLVKK